MTVGQLIHELSLLPNENEVLVRDWEYDDQPVLKVFLENSKVLLDTWFPVGD